ncbi:MAG: dihydropteroate synthase [SAR202 cluster bacterium]|nr:dihydropteroate synthase [SAR202 cluster bacterium]|tara:strand:+ start:139 stop:1020 length:882 start_codon:yes stop_codon:yes gene_type:complete
MTDTSYLSSSTTIGERSFQWGARTYVMGIVNVTGDSFSGDGLNNDVEATVTQALAFQEAGAHLIDVGGESTRPPGATYGQGAAPVSADEELSRVIPVIERLHDALSIPISIDTYKADVARQAVAAGASLINDVWGLQRDPELAAVVAETGAPLVLMHNQAGTEYNDLLPDVLASLRESVDVARKAGVASDAIIVDPGIGFGKTVQHNLELLRRLREFKDALGYPVLVGVSRKSTIGTVLGGLPPEDRVEGTAAAIALSIAHGADIVRVHDVQAMVRVARMTDAIVRGWSPPSS